MLFKSITFFLHLSQGGFHYAFCEELALLLLRHPVQKAINYRFVVLLISSPGRTRLSALRYGIPGGSVDDAQTRAGDPNGCPDTLRSDVYLRATWTDTNAWARLRDVNPNPRYDRPTLVEAKICHPHSSLFYSDLIAPQKLTILRSANSVNSLLARPVGRV